MVAEEIVKEAEGISRRFAQMSADQEEVVSLKKLKGRCVAAPALKFRLRVPFVPFVVKL